MSNTPNIQWAAILQDALTTPGRISAAYRMFHQFSIGNIAAAWWQCASRGIEMGPLATFKRWNELGRKVKKGQKAIWLSMPITIKAKEKTPEGEEKRAVTFVWKPLWFALSQTEGPVTPEYASTPEWHVETMLAELEITQENFQESSGLGVSHPRQGKVAVSPLGDSPTRTLIHEVAHCLLHKQRGQAAGEMELEAECVAVLVCEALGLPYNAESSRAYIQQWWPTRQVSERTAQRIFSAANQIIKAGQVKPACADEQAAA